MLNNNQQYHFVLTTGREVEGRVLASDDQKILVSTADSPEPLNKVTIYRQAIALVEPLGPAPRQGSAQAPRQGSAQAPRQGSTQASQYGLDHEFDD